MYDGIASDPMYEAALIEMGCQPCDVPSPVSPPAKSADLTDAVRGSREANVFRKQIAAALWCDYLSALQRRGMTVEEKDDTIQINIDEINV